MHPVARLTTAAILLTTAFVVGGTETATARASTIDVKLAPVLPDLRDTTRSSMDGVYTAAQATKGKDVFAAYCRSCHTPTVHSGPPFRARWYGHTLGELFGYLRREMPKNDPGSMSDEEYALALVYLLRINEMPAGSEPLVADSAALHRIRLDSVRATSSPRAPHR